MALIGSDRQEVLGAFDGQRSADKRQLWRFEDGGSCFIVAGAAGQAQAPSATETSVRFCWLRASRAEPQFQPVMACCACAVDASRTMRSYFNIGFRRAKISGASGSMALRNA